MLPKQKAVIGVVVAAVTTAALASTIMSQSTHVIVINDDDTTFDAHLRVKSAAESDEVVRLDCSKDEQKAPHAHRNCEIRFLRNEVVQPKSIGVTVTDGKPDATILQVDE